MSQRDKQDLAETAQKNVRSEWATIFDGMVDCRTRLENYDVLYRTTPYFVADFRTKLDKVRFAIEYLPLSWIPYKFRGELLTWDEAKKRSMTRADRATISLSQEGRSLYYEKTKLTLADEFWAVKHQFDRMGEVLIKNNFFEKEEHRMTADEIPEPGEFE